jgi:choice-of-anchor B domain-containing protein
VRSLLALLLLVASVLAQPLRADDAHDEGFAIGDASGAATGPALSGVACVAGAAAGFPCRNVDLRAFVPVADLGTTRINDVWAWTDPLTGTEYALVGTLEGAVFVSLADPDHPLVVARVASPTTTSLWGDLRVYADHAVMVKESAGHGLQIFDLTRLRNVPVPGVTLLDDARYTGFGNAHTVSVNEATGLAVAAGSNTCSGGLHLLDLADPLEPAFLGCYAGDGYTHDVECVVYAGPDADHQGAEICFASNIDTLTIVDVSDAAAPVQLARAGYPGVGYVHQGWLTPDQRHFVQNDELDEQRSLHPTRTHVWDVADLDAPSWRGFHEHATAAIDHNLVVVGNHVFEANYRAGVRVLRTGRLADAELAEIAAFDTIPADDAALFSGVWGVHPLDSGLVIASDIFGGLFVLEPHLDAVPECDDDIDNDQDGRIDAAGGPNGELRDPGCASALDASEGASLGGGGCGLGAELVPVVALLAALRVRRR